MTSVQIPELRNRYGKLWSIAVRIVERQPGDPRSIRLRAMLLIAAIVAALVVSAVVGWVGWSGFVSRTDPPVDVWGAILVGVLYLVAIVLGSASGLRSGNVIEPQLLRNWPIRSLGKFLCVLMGLNALILVAACLVLSEHTPTWIASAALLLGVGARVSWWAAQDGTPPLIGLVENRPLDRMVSLLMHWGINASVLFGALGFIAVQAKSPQLFTASAALAITLTVVARARADAAAIRASVSRLEQALAAAYVATERFSRTSVTGEVLPSLQEALLELRGAMSNSEGSRLPHRIPNADPVHLMMVTYLCRRLGGINVRLQESLDVYISSMLLREGVTDRKVLAQQGADYVLALAEQLTGDAVHTADFGEYRGEHWTEKLEEHFPTVVPAARLGDEA